ncbi:hypothetical protein HNV12_03080 [Methanococcoides sp. SA1]|nr:hypothetical protein [Methanococcoides sp. SA1]
MVSLEGAVDGVQNWAIDSSAKAIVYSVPMGAMEAGINYVNTGGVQMDEVLATRAGVVLVDAVAARVYTKLADHLYDRFDIDPENGGLKAWATDSVAMILPYNFVYGCILGLSGDSGEEIGAKLGIGAGVALLTSRPFRKYILAPWRKFWNFRG